MTRQIGTHRNDSRKPRLPKNPEKLAKEMRIREWANNNGCSIRAARIYWEQDEE